MIQPQIQGSFALRIGGDFAEITERAFDLFAPAARPVGKEGKIGAGFSSRQQRVILCHGSTFQINETGGVTDTRPVARLGVAFGLLVVSGVKSGVKHQSYHRKQPKEKVVSR